MNIMQAAEQLSLAITPELLELVDEREEHGYKPGWLLYRAFDLELNDDDFRFLAGELGWSLDWLRISYSQARMKQRRSPLPQPSTPDLIAPDGSEFGELWADVLNAIPRPGTRAILQTQCSLVDFDGAASLILITSSPMQRMVTSKIPDIERAFFEVCNRLIEVLLEVEP
ncbi:MAG: hypothetical protein WBA57_27465 [Elainellaceae cyanobacterium]